MTLVEAARSLMNVRWQHQGRSREAVDCIGLLVLAERDCGRDVADRTNYGKVPTRRELAAGMDAHYGPTVFGARPSLSDLQPGDKVLICLAGSKEANHVAIVGDSPNGLTLIHAWSGGLCRVTEHILDAKWLRRIEGVWR